jgi:hypothetical protein
LVETIPERPKKDNIYGEILINNINKSKIGPFYLKLNSYAPINLNILALCLKYRAILINGSAIILRKHSRTAMRQHSRRPAIIRRRIYRQGPKG